MSEIPSIADLKRFAASVERRPDACNYCQCVLAKGQVTSVFGVTLCSRCAASVLKHVVAPHLSELGTFAEAETKMIAAIARVEDDERAGRSSVPIPLAADPEIENTDWACSKCTLQNTALKGRCTGCGFPKPEPPVCPLCFRSYIRSRLCHYTKRHHETWKCGDCETVNLSSSVQCRSCRNMRTWFCEACSLQNTFSATSCAACAGVLQASSLGSFVNRAALRDLGLDIREMKQEKESVEDAVENKDRLEYRVEQVCLRPVPVADDGNCLFRAISLQVCRTDAFHRAIRILCAEYVLQHPNEFAAFEGESFSSAVEQLRCDGSWGDELAVRAASLALPANIHIITSDHAKWHRKYYTNSRRHLVLCYCRPNHYYCAVLQSRDVACPALDLPRLIAALPEAADVAPPTLTTETKAADTPATAVVGGGEEVSLGPMAKPLPPRDEHRHGDSIRVAKTPNYRLTQSDFPRLPPISIVYVSLGDSSAALSVRESGEVVGSIHNRQHFYLHMIPHETVKANETGRFAAAQRLVSWEQTFPLFMLQRVDTKAFLTPSVLSDDVVFGALHRTTTIARVLTNTMPTDLSAALMTAECGDKGPTIFTLRFVSEALPCRRLFYVEERVFCCNDATNTQHFMFIAPFRLQSQRFCTRCREFYRADEPTGSNGCTHVNIARPHVF